MYWGLFTRRLACLCGCDLLVRMPISARLLFFKTQRCIAAHLRFHRSFIGVNIVNARLSFGLFIASNMNLLCDVLERVNHKHRN